MNKILKYILPLFLMILSCHEDIDYIVETEYQYANSTNSTIDIKLYDEGNNLIRTIIIKPSETYKEIVTKDGPKNGIARPFASVTVVVAKINVKFENTNKCITYVNDEGILDYINYDNYNSSMLNKSKNILIFNFGAEEENIAIPCI